MDSTVSKLFGKELIDALEGLLNDFVTLSLGEREIYKNIKDLNETVRTYLYLMAVDKGYKDVAFRIDKANKLLKDERVLEFKKAFDQGRSKKYLISLSKMDKISLMVDLKIDVSDEEALKLSKIQQLYRKKIKDSMMVDQKIDKRDGVEKFLKYKKDEV